MCQAWEYTAQISHKRACWEERGWLTASSPGTFGVYSRLYHSHAFPVLLPVDDCRCGRAKPSCCSNVQCLLCSSPLAQLRLSQSLHWSLRLLLPHPPSFHLSFHRCQNCITDWGAPTFPYLLLPSLSRLSFTGVSPNKSLALLGPSLHLLPGGSKQIL